jgi:hypothetical protein
VYAVMSLLADAIESGVRRAGRAQRDAALAGARPHTCMELAGTDELSRLTARATGSPVTAPLSGRTCVWYTVHVHEWYSGYRSGPLGPGQHERQNLVAELAGGLLALTDDTGTVYADVAAARIDLDPPAFEDFESRTDSSGALTARMAQLFGAPLPAPKHGKLTLGYLVEEWTVGKDDELTVIGRPQTRDGQIVLAGTKRQPLWLRPAGE